MIERMLRQRTIELFQQHSVAFLPAVMNINRSDDKTERIARFRYFHGGFDPFIQRGCAGFKAFNDIVGIHAEAEARFSAPKASKPAASKEQTSQQKQNTAPASSSVSAYIE